MRLGLPHHLIGRSDRPSRLAVGHDLLVHLIEAHPGVDAVSFANDELAAGALFECARRGVRVPEDLAIMGFSGEEITSHFTLALTTVRIPRHEMGRLTADLLARLNGRLGAQPPIDVGFEIVQRQTTHTPAPSSGEAMTDHTERPELLIVAPMTPFVMGALERDHTTQRL